MEPKSSSIPLPLEPLMMKGKKTSHLLPIACDVFFHFIMNGSDGSGIEDDFGSIQRCDAGCLRKPLVEADQRADFSEGCIKNFDAGVSWFEVMLLVIQDVFGNVCLSVRSEHRAIGIEHGSRVIAFAVLSQFVQ